MRFIHGVDAYRLEFTREWEEVAVPNRPPASPALLLARDVFAYFSERRKLDPLQEHAATIMATEGATEFPRRPRTTVILCREVVTPKAGEPGKEEMTFKEIGHATCRFYHKDSQETREAGRRQALRRLCPFIAEELRPLVWKAYLCRKETSSGSLASSREKDALPTTVPSEARSISTA